MDLLGRLKLQLRERERLWRQGDRQADRQTDRQLSAYIYILHAK